MSRTVETTIRRSRIYAIKTFRESALKAVSLQKCASLCLALAAEVLLVSIATLGLKQESGQSRGFPDAKAARQLDSSWRTHKDYALLFATNTYDSWPQLSNPIPDAHAIADELHQNYDFDTRVVENPTRDQIRSTLRDYSKRAFGQGDQLFIFFAGHGLYDDVFKQGFIVTRDSKKGDTNQLTYESYDDLRQIINSIPAKHILLILDACFSGTFDRRIGESTTRAADSYADFSFEELFANKAQIPTRKYLTSGGKEYVPDGSPGHHSPLAGHILEILRTYGGSQGYLTFESLLAGVENTRPQPLWGEWGDNEPGSEFLFASKRFTAVLDPGQPSVQSGIEHGGSAATVVQGNLSRGMAIRPSIAVLGFKNLSGQPQVDWIATAITDILGTKLGQGGALRMISQENIARMKLDLGLTDFDKLTPEVLAAVRRNSGSDFVIMGAYSDSPTSAGDQIRVDWRVQDTSSGNTIAEWSDTSTESDLGGVVERSASTLLRRFDLQQSSEVGERPAPPVNREALRLYSQGMAALRQFNAMAAKDYLEKSISLDQQNSLAHASLASAWSSLGYDGRAKDQAKIALDLSGGLDREDQLLAQGQYHEFSFDWERAIQAYRELVESFPDNVDYRVRLGALQISDSVPQEALQTLAHVQQLPPASRNDPRIDIEIAKAADALADFTRMSQAATAAISKGRDQGARLLVARALDLKGTALGKLGDPAGGGEALREAETIYLSEGDRNGVAEELFGLARLARNTNNFVSATDLYQRSLATYQDSGNIGGVAESRNGIGLIEWDQGDLAQSKKTLEEALALARGISNKRIEAGILGNLGNVANDGGELELSETYHGQAIAAYREIGDKAHLANELNSLGALLFDQGDLEQARNMEEQALPIARDVRDRKTEAYILSATGEILTQMGDLEHAKANHEAALAIWNETGRTLDAAYDSASLAWLSAEQGQLQQAEKPLRAALATFEEKGETEYVLTASSYLIDVLLAQRKLTEAETEAQRVSQVAAKSQLPIAQLRVLIRIASVDAEVGKSAKALNELKLVLDKAQKSSFIQLELEARCAIGNVERKSNPALAKADLDRVIADANARGFHFIANMASRIAASNRQHI